MLGKNLSGGLQVENSVFIPDTLLLSTEVLPGIICSGEVTGNNGHCCLFHHSWLLKDPRKRLFIWGTPISSGSGAASGEASICGRQEHSFLVYSHVYPFPTIGSVLYFFSFFWDQTKIPNRMMWAHMCIWDWNQFLRDQSLLCYQLFSPQSPRFASHWN